MIAGAIIRFPWACFSVLFLVAAWSFFAHAGLKRNTPSLLEWYRILRAHDHWTIWQALRFALWLWR